MQHELSAILNPEQQFRKLFDTHVEQVFDYIFAITRSKYLSEEVSQELFLILWRKKEDLHAIRNIEHYIFRIARNLAIRLLQKAALDGKMAGEWYTRLPHQTDAVEEDADRLNAQLLIEQAVNALPAQRQKVYFLSRRDHLNFDEIALQMGISRHTVRNHLNKALHDIREYLLNNGYQPMLVSLIDSVTSSVSRDNY